MSTIVTTQAELDGALEAGALDILIKSPRGVWLRIGDSATVEAWDSATVEAWGSATVEAWGSATVRAWDSATVRASGSATVEAWDSATVRASGSATVEAWGSATVEASGSATVEAWDSATVRASGSATVGAWDSATVRASDSATVRAFDSATVEAWGSATVRAWGSATVRAFDSATVRASDSATVEAWGSATVRASGSATVRASGSATVEAWGSATVRASRFTAVFLHSQRVTLDAKGALIDLTELNLDDITDWCDYHGVEVTDGKAIVYKAVDDNFETTRHLRTTYTVGETVTCPDWQATRSCGNGLHFGRSPRNAEANAVSEVTHYLACEIDLDKAIPLTDKVKAPSCRVLHEVDRFGDRIEPAKVSA